MIKMINLDKKQFKDFLMELGKRKFVKKKLLFH